jgi:hypothetical protein
VNPFKLDAEIEQETINKLYARMIEQTGKEMLGIQSTHTDEPTPSLVLDVLENALDAIYPTIYYQTNPWLDKTNEDGKSIAYKVKDIQCFFIHPDNLDMFAALCKTNGYRLKQYDWKTKPHKFTQFIPRDINGNPV